MPIEAYILWYIIPCAMALVKIWLKIHVPIGLLQVNFQMIHVDTPGITLALIYNLSVLCSRAWSQGYKWSLLQRLKHQQYNMYSNSHKLSFSLSKTRNQSYSQTALIEQKQYVCLSVSWHPCWTLSPYWNLSEHLHYCQKIRGTHGTLIRVTTSQDWKSCQNIYNPLPKYASNESRFKLAASFKVVGGILVSSIWSLYDDPKDLAIIFYFQ